VGDTVTTGLEEIVQKLQTFVKCGDGGEEVSNNFPEALLNI
jgi:hypothetical protein